MNESTLVPREHMVDAITYLARNVHGWPSASPTIIPAGDSTFEYGANFYEDKVEIIGVIGMITKDQWLSRRTELQNKPNWADAPEWAGWLAQDEDGQWYWYCSEPFVDETNDDKMWDFGDSFDHEDCEFGEVLGDWRDTLEKRPEQKAFEPLTSIEDNQEKGMKQDNGWFERGDLPPVGIAVQLWHGGTYAYDCELIAKRGNDFVLWNLTWDRPDSADCMMCVFKPTPTEREVLADLIESHGQMSALVVADAILAAGFKRDGGAA